MSYDHKRVHRLLEESAFHRSAGRTQIVGFETMTDPTLRSLDAKLDAILEIVMDGEPLIIMKPDADG